MGAVPAKKRTLALARSSLTHGILEFAAFEIVISRLTRPISKKTITLIVRLVKNRGKTEQIDSFFQTFFSY